MVTVSRVHVTCDTWLCYSCVTLLHMTIGFGYEKLPHHSFDLVTAVSREVLKFRVHERDGGIFVQYHHGGTDVLEYGPIGVQGMDDILRFPEVPFLLRPEGPGSLL